jgi:hypothetical protein
MSCHYADRDRNGLSDKGRRESGLRLFVQAPQLNIDAITAAASMTLARRQQLARLLGTFCLDTPFLGPNDVHGGVISLQP